MNEKGKVTKKRINYFVLNNSNNDDDDDDGTDFTNDLSINVQFAVYLCKTDRFDKFEIWFNNISKCNSQLLFELMKNEDFCLCIVRLRFFQRKYEQVFNLLKSGPFSAQEDYVKLWENSHYKQKEETLGQPLTPLQRFRIRKKFPPPANICPYGRQIINPLFKQASVTMKRWFQEHSAHPYPSLQEKQMLARQTGLTLYQVKTWFANTRRRKKVRQMRSSLECHRLLNKNHFLLDSEQLEKGSSEALDLSIQNLEKKGELENVLTDQEGGMDTDDGLERSVEDAGVNLGKENTQQLEIEKGQHGSKESHRCCLYCPEFGEAPSNKTDHNPQQSGLVNLIEHNKQQSGSSSRTGTFPNMDLEAESSSLQNSANVPNFSGRITDSDLFRFLLSKQHLLDENLQMNANNFKPFPSSEKTTKSLTRQQSEITFQILNKTTSHTPSHFRPFNTGHQQQVATHSCDAVPIPPPMQSPFVTNLTNTTRRLPELVYSNPTINPLPVLTTPVDPPVDPPATLPTFRQDGSFLPNNQNLFDSSVLLSHDNSESSAKTTEQDAYSAFLNLTPSCSSEYPQPDAPCPAAETLSFAVISLPNNSSVPLSKPSSGVNSDHHLQIIPASNLRPVQMDNEHWIQMPGSCDQSPSTNHNRVSLGTSMSQMSRNLEEGITGTRELMILETEIAHTLLRLSRRRE